MTDSTFNQFLNRPVVLDTGGPMLYLGTLAQVTPSAFILTDADVRDSRLGHANSDVYVNEARRNGIVANRRRVVVMRSVVMSVSLIEDVILE